MKVYLAGERSFKGATPTVSRPGEEAGAGLLARPPVRRRLVSYHYHGFSGYPFQRDPETGLSAAIVEAKRFGCDLLLDSGAYTVSKRHTHIPPWEFAEYVELTQSTWTAVSSLDTIGRGEKAARSSYDMFTWLRRHGAKVQPVWHVREPERWLLRYLDEGHDYIFIGGMVGERTPWLKGKLDTVWTNHLTDLDGLPKVKVHGFGLTNRELLFRYPWYSVDSASWLKDGINGSCLLRNPETSELRKYFFDEQSWSKQKSPHYRGLGVHGDELSTSG